MHSLKVDRSVLRRLSVESANNQGLTPDRRSSIENWLNGVSKHSNVRSGDDSCSYGDGLSPRPGPRDSGVEIATLGSVATSTSFGTQAASSSLRKVQVCTPLSGRSSRSRLHIPPAVRTYHKYCRKLRILPLRRVLAQFGRERIILVGLCMSPTDIKAACKALKYEATATYLDFSGNNITQTEVVYIIRLLDNNPLFTELRLADNRLSGAGIQHLTQFLCTYRFIRVLDISGNKLTDTDGVCVASLIKHCISLRVLHAHHNEFRESAGKVIGKAIAETSSLEELDLCWNHLRQQGAIGIARGLEKNTSLDYVNLGWNGFAFEGCVAMSDALRVNTCLEKLDLSCNRIHPPALLELMKGLCSNKVLKILVLDNNPITPSFSTVLLEGIRKSKTMNLQDLSLKGIVVDKEFQGVYDDIQKERSFQVCYETSLPVSCRNRQEMIEEVEMRNNYNVEPLRMLYLLKEKYRAQDFFHKINKDHNDCLTPDELHALFKESGIPVSKFVIDKIMQFMDTDGDGAIDLAEFLVGDKKIKKISRDHARNSLQLGDEEHYSHYSRTFRKAHIQQITSRLQVEEGPKYLSPIASLGPSPASSRRSSIRSDQGM